MDEEVHDEQEGIQPLLQIKIKDRYTAKANFCIP
jgi:hypothetical protein